MREGSTSGRGHLTVYRHTMQLTSSCSCESETQSFILGVQANDEHNLFFFKCTEQLLERESCNTATLVAGKRSKAKTPHCNPASPRELVIKTHTLPVSPKHQMLLAIQWDISLCICFL